MLVETSSSGKITTSGNPFVFRISPPSALEAETFAPTVGKLGLKKVDFLVLNNDFGRGAAADFGKMLKEKGVQVGLVETMDQGAQDMSAQLAKLKASDSDTIMITSAVDQLVLLFKQMSAIGLKKRVITTGGSQNPDQIIAQAGSAAEGTMHLTTFLPWLPEKTRLRRHPGDRARHREGRLGRARGHHQGVLVGGLYRAQRPDPLRQGRSCRQGERAEQA
jgi:branched-chain amino acid transport system substrate-binding protein